MSETRPKCPACGRFVGDAYDDGVENSPGFGDAAYHDPEGCFKHEGDVDGVVIFCDVRCADRFHERSIEENPR